MLRCRNVLVRWGSVRVVVGVGVGEVGVGGGGSGVRVRCVMMRWVVVVKRWRCVVRWRALVVVVGVVAIVLLGLAGSSSKGASGRC